MPKKESIVDPWTAVCCARKFPKNKGYEKLQNLDFSNLDVRTQIKNTRNNETEFYKTHKLWFDHLLCMPDNALFDGRCPKSLCVFCAINERPLLYNFNNRGGYGYHRKKCPLRDKNLKCFTDQHKFFDKESYNLLLE